MYCTMTFGTPLQPFTSTKLSSLRDRDSVYRDSLFQYFPLIGKSLIPKPAPVNVAASGSKTSGIDAASFPINAKSRPHGEDVHQESSKEPPLTVGGTLTFRVLLNSTTPSNPCRSRVMGQTHYPAVVPII